MTNSHPNYQLAHGQLSFFLRLDVPVVNWMSLRLRAVASPPGVLNPVSLGHIRERVYDTEAKASIT